MKNIRTNSKRRWIAFKQTIREFFFKLFAVRRITGMISKTYYNLIYNTGKDYDSIFMVPSEFKKYSDEEIEHALNILVKHNKLISWCKTIQHNEDGYLLVLISENRSQRRFYNNIPEEINSNQVKIEQISLQPMETENIKTVEEIKQTPTNNTVITKVEEHAQPIIGSELIDDGKPF